MCGSWDGTLAEGGRHTMLSRGPCRHVETAIFRGFVALARPAKPAKYRVACRRANAGGSALLSRRLARQAASRVSAGRFLPAFQRDKFFNTYAEQLGSRRSVEEETGAGFRTGVVG